MSKLIEKWYAFMRKFADTDYVMQVDFHGGKVSIDGSEFVEILSPEEKKTFKLVEILSSGEKETLKEQA